MKFILIVATGRSGSTTLQRIINTIDKSNITGENNNFIFTLLKAYNNLRRTIKMTPKINNKFISSLELEKLQKKPCWYNSFDLEKIKDDLRKIIIDFLSTDNNLNVLGFKEIRWHEDYKLINEFIDLFPNTKVIMHYREDIEKQSKSGWFAKNKDAISEITKLNKDLIEFYNQNKDSNKYYLNSFNNLFDIKKMKELFKFLEENLNILEYNRIINNNLK
jgi:hypothetical protein